MRHKKTDDVSIVLNEFTAIVEYGIIKKSN